MRSVILVDFYMDNTHPENDTDNNLELKSRDPVAFGKYSQNELAQN